MRWASVLLVGLLLSACTFDFEGTPPLTPALRDEIASAEAAVYAAESDPARRVAVAQAYEAAGRYFDAAEQLKKATELAPSDGAARAKLARLYERLGYFPEAFLQLRKCLDHDPNDPDCLYATGAMLKHDGSPGALAQARVVWQRFLAVAPEHGKAADVRKGLAQIDAQAPKRPASQPAPSAPAGDIAAAVPSAEGGAHLPGHENVQGDDSIGALNPFGQAIGVAMAAVRAKDPAAAEAAYRKALALRPNDAGALAGLAETLHKLEKGSEAQQVAQQAYAADPAHPQARWVFGLVMLKAGHKIGEALEAWRALSRDEPEYAKQLGVTRTLEEVDRMSGRKTSGSPPQ